jgi:2-methylcitrate dehydratase PrpD
MNASRVLGAFVADTTWNTIPGAVRNQVNLLLADFLFAAVTGRTLEAPNLLESVAGSWSAVGRSSVLAADRHLSPPTAAWVNGSFAGALDIDDGHAAIGGHPGAPMFSAALAVAEESDRSPEDFMAAVVVGYEVGIRAGLSIGPHNSEMAWACLGSAAASCNLLQAGPSTVGHALGWAEFHAPQAPLRWALANPSMAKDGSPWAALVGVTAAYLALAGMTAPPTTVADSTAGWNDLGDRWRIEDVYIKEFPTCRWVHPAIAATLLARSSRLLDAEDIRRIRIRTFRRAAELDRGKPPDTPEEAQYSLAWPVAIAATTGTFKVEHLDRSWLRVPKLRRLVGRIETTVDPSLDSSNQRLAAATIELADGTRLESPAVPAPGEPGDVQCIQIVREKLRQVSSAHPGWIGALPRLLHGALKKEGTTSRHGLIAEN